MTSNLPRLVKAAAACGLMLALAGCNGSTPPQGPGQSAALPAMQAGPTSVGAAGLGPAGSDSGVGSGNLAGPAMGAGPGLH